MNAQHFKQKLLSDAKVKLTEEFKRNFERKAFFSDKWKPRANPNAKGTLLMVSSKLFRSIRGEVHGNGVRITSAVPYAVVHNEGGKISQNVRAHRRKGKHVKAHQRTINMPQRQFVGDGKETRKILKEVIDKNLQKLGEQLADNLKKQ